MKITGAVVAEVLFNVTAVSVGRIFAGIAPASVPTFAVARLVGGGAALVLIRALYRDVGPAAVGLPRPT